MQCVLQFHFKSTVKITPRSLYFLTFSIVVFPMVIGLSTVVLYSKGSITISLHFLGLSLIQFFSANSRKSIQENTCEERAWFVRKIPEINMYSRKLNRYVMQDVLTTTLYYVHSYISELVRDLHVFDNNVAVPDVLETVFFQFKLVPVCGKCLIHPLFVLYLFCSTPATVVHIVNSQ